MTRPLRGHGMNTSSPVGDCYVLKDTFKDTPYVPLKSQLGRHQQHQCRHLPEQVDQSLVMFWNRHGSEIFHKMWRYTIPNRGLWNGAYPYDWEDGFLKNCWLMGWFMSGFTTVSPSNRRGTPILWPSGTDTSAGLLFPIPCSATR